MSDTREITDIERAACTILSQAHTYRRPLTIWVKAIVSDPSFTDDLDAETSRQVSRGLPYVEDEINGDPQLPQSLDSAAEALARAVVQHRLAGGQDGDRTTFLGTRDMAVGYVTTSLAAAVAEHVRNIANAWANELQRTKDEN